MSFIKKRLNKIKHYIISNFAFCSVISAVLIYAVVFSTICILKYNAFSYRDFDFAIFIQKYWNILHGNTSVSLIGDTKIWGNALEIISIPFSLIYALLFLSPKSLLILKSLLLGLGAIPIYLIAKREIPKNLGACLAISYLFYPPLWFVNLFEYNDIFLVTLTLLFAFYFLKKNQFGYFLIFTIISILCRVDIAVVTAMFGIYAILDRKSIKWVISPLIISILYLIIGVFIVIPAFQTEARYDVFYYHFGRNPAEIVKNILLHPSILISSLLTKQNAIFLSQILFPVGFVSLLTLKEFMICIISLVQHLASLRLTEHTIYFHYTVTITPFIFISAIYGLSKLVDSKINRRTLLIVLSALPIMSNLLYGPLSNVKGLLAQLKKDNLDEQKEILLSKIPKDAAVISTFEFTPRLANRRYLYSFHYVVRPPQSSLYTMPRYKIPNNITYAIIDFTDSLTLEFCDNQSDKRIRDFLEKRNWGLIESVNNIALFKSGYPSNIKLFEIRSADLNKKALVVKTTNNLKLSAYSLKVNKKQENTFLNMSFYWGCLGKIEDDIGMVFQVFDKNDRLIHVDARPICHGIYPTQRWSESEEMIDNYNLSLPKHIKSGEYSIKMLLFSRINYNIIPLIRDNNNIVVDSQQRLLLDIIKL